MTTQRIKFIVVLPVHQCLSKDVSQRKSTLCECQEQEARFWTPRNRASFNRYRKLYEFSVT